MELAKTLPMDPSGKRIVLFGGAFDPPHVGHLTMAQLALEQTGADGVWLLPTPVPPHKRMAQPHLALREEMVGQLIAGYHGLHLCTIEETLGTPSYTVDTVAWLQQRFPDAAFSFLIGTDSLAHLPSWHEADRLTRAVPFLVAARSGFPYEQTLENVRLDLPRLRTVPLNMPLLDVSSTWIRDRLSLGQPLCGLCPDAVVRVWKSQGNKV